MINKVGIIGAGKLGAALAEKLQSIGLLAFVVDRSGRLSEADFPSIKLYRAIEDIDTAADFISLPVPDSEIRNVAEQLAVKFADSPVIKSICHFSGTMPRAELSPAGVIAEKLFATHPMQTFGVSRSDVFNGIFWGIDADDNAIETADEFVRLLGGFPFPLSEVIKENKAMYHAIGVSAANFLQSAVEFSRLLTTNSNLPEKQLLLPILRTAFDNAISAINSNQDFPITGPIARADIATIEKHLESLANNEDLAAIYRDNSRALCRIAYLKGMISTKDFDNMIGILKP